MKSQHLNIKIFFSLSKGSSDDFKVNYAEKEIGARVSESSRKWYDHDYDALYSMSYTQLWYHLVQTQDRLYLLQFNDYTHRLEPDTWYSPARDSVFRIGR